MSISENTARNDLTPIEEARAYAGYLSGDDYSQGNLSSKIGVSQEVISKRVSLLDLPESIQAMVENKTLMIRPAEIIARLRQLEDRKFAEAKVLLSGGPYAVTVSSLVNDSSLTAWKLYPTGRHG